MDQIDLVLLALPALVVVPLTFQAVGLWSWTAWLPFRLRAIEDRRAYEFIEDLTQQVVEEKFPPLLGPSRAADERTLMGAFAEVAGAVVQALPPSAESARTMLGPAVTDRLRSLAEEVLADALDSSSTNRAPKRRRLAADCLEILERLPSRSSVDAVRRALCSPDPEIARRAALAIASAPRSFREAISPPSADRGEGDETIYRIA